MKTENVKTDSTSACILTLYCLFYWCFFCILGFSSVLPDTSTYSPLCVGLVFRWLAFRKEVFTSSESSQSILLDWATLLNPVNCFCVSAGRCLSLVRSCMIRNTNHKGIYMFLLSYTFINSSFSNSEEERTVGC